MIRRAAAAVLLVAVGACGSPPGERRPAVSRALVEQGERLATSLACGSCHSVDGSKKLGPTWKGLAGARVELESGGTVVAGDAYLAESIRDPDAQTVKGFPVGVMANVIKPGSVSDDEIRALIAYIKSL